MKQELNSATLLKTNFVLQVFKSGQFSWSKILAALSLYLQDCLNKFKSNIKNIYNYMYFQSTKSHPFYNKSVTTKSDPVLIMTYVIKNI